MATRSVGEIMDELTEKLREAHALIDKLMAPPSGVAVVLSISQHDVIVSIGGETVLVEKPAINITVGDCVALQGETKQITKIIADHGAIEDIGPVGHVEAVSGGVWLEVAIGGQTREVLRGKLTKVEVGDRVVLDSSGYCAVKNIGQEERFTLNADVNVVWEDIGGQAEAVASVQSMIEDPIRFAELYKQYKAKPTKGILFGGPPGCGKTMLGKAAANAIAKLYKKDKGGFLYVKGPEILNMFVGKSEENVRQIFANARKFHKEKGHPALLFIDEGDAILRKRGSGISSDIGDTVVPAFLAEMDGLVDSGTMVIIATNRPDLLDPAVTREGRIDQKVLVQRPGEAGTKEILQIYVNKLGCFSGKKDATVKMVTKFMFSDELPVLTAHYKDGRKDKAFVRDIVSGAMIESMVNRSALHAIERDKKAKEAKASGVNAEDLLWAVGQVWRDNLMINHDDLVQEKWGEHNDDIEKIVRVKATF